MTILSVMQDAAMAVGLPRPTVVFGSTDRQWQEMQSIANEAAKTIAEAHDWQALQAAMTLNGDGIAEDFDLPADYARMLVAGDLWSSRFAWNMVRILNLNDWLAMDTYPFTPVNGAWALFGNQMHLRPVMGIGESAKFGYIRNTIVKPFSGDLKTAFSDDKDSFVLDERVLKLCIIYLRKQHKGQDFAAELADYEGALDKATDNDGGSKPKISGRAPEDWRCGNVWPGTVSG